MQERKKKAEDAVQEQKKVVAKAKTEQKQKADDLSKWDDAYSNLLTLEGVVEYGKNCTRKGHEKYVEKFRNVDGRCTAMRRCAYTMRLCS